MRDFGGEDLTASHDGRCGVNLGPTRKSLCPLLSTFIRGTACNEKLDAVPVIRVRKIWNWLLLDLNMDSGKDKVSEDVMTREMIYFFISYERRQR